MDKNQEAAIEEYSDDLIKVLRPSLNESVLPYLMFRKVITPEDRLAIEKRLSDFDKVYQLFEILKAKVKGWQGLIDFLKHEGQTVLAAKLENLAKATASSKDSSTAGGHAGNL